MSDVTRILAAIERGDVRAVDELFPLVYQELRQLAAQRMSRELPGQTLQATALVHEAYLRLVGAEDQNWDGRTHLRRILIDNARRKKSLKHGGGRQRVDLDDGDIAVEAPSDNLVALDEALTKLAKKAPAVAELVKLRYFAGLTVEQVAEIQGISRRTAGSHWAYARAWLHREITKGGGLTSQ